MRKNSMQEKKQKQESKGFTLVEILVAMFIFVLIGGATINLAVSGISNQRRALATQEGIGQASFLAEYMSRALREAEKDLGDECTTQNGLNYELFDVDGDGKKEKIIFLDERGKCREFFLESSQIKERISSDNTLINFGDAELLTSDDLTIADFVFNIEGASQGDGEQPRVTFLLEMQTDGKTILLQTTISQRKFDIQLQQ